MKNLSKVIPLLFFSILIFGSLASTSFAADKKQLVYTNISADSNAFDYIHNNKVPAIVEHIFQQVFGKKINKTESDYWKQRARTDKATESKLKGAMLFQKGKNLTMPKVAAASKATSGKVAGITSDGLVDCVFDDDFGHQHQFLKVTSDYCNQMLGIWRTGYKPLPIPTYTPITYTPIATAAPIKPNYTAQNQACKNNAENTYQGQVVTARQYSDSSVGQAILQLALQQLNNSIANCNAWYPI